MGIKRLGELRRDAVMAAHKWCDLRAEKKTPPPPPAAKSETAAYDPPKPPDGPLDFEKFRFALASADSAEQANAIYDLWVTRRTDALHPDELDECDNLLRERCDKFGMGS
jgi:hypothetical protein